MGIGRARSQPGNDAWPALGSGQYGGVELRSLTAARKAGSVAGLRPGHCRQWQLPNSASDGPRSGQGAERPACTFDCSAGVSIGVIEHGVRRVLLCGQTRVSLQEIGSMSKTFTGIILAQMVNRARSVLDEPVRELLPAGTVTKPTGPEVTRSGHAALRAAAHAGQLQPADGANPYADYHAASFFTPLSASTASRCGWGAVSLQQSWLRVAGPGAGGARGYLSATAQE